MRIRPAVGAEEGAFEFKSKLVSVKRHADGTTFSGWVAPQGDSPCTITLALHSSTVAADLRSRRVEVATRMSNAEDEAEGMPQEVQWKEATGGEEGEYVVHGARCVGGGSRLRFALRADDPAGQLERVRTRESHKS